MDPADRDLALALQLQEQFNNESSVEPQISSSKSSQKDLSPVDPSWETLDPNPDIRALFLQFNEQFFWGRLAGIEVKWSPRMTLCAGLCCYEGRGGLCSVRLSVPLLKLRPRKDLVETLLHEMIHAYLFVTDNNKDHDGHGPEFHKHMYRINSATGANISVYHTFHDEVAEYRQHWWRCNGPCQNRKPYYGYVKRAMNRAPSARDPWFKDHQNSCNGTFIKIKEPENYGKKKGKDKDENKNNKDKESNKAASKNMDIRKFAGKGHSLTGTSTTKQSSVIDEPTLNSHKENVLKVSSETGSSNDSKQTKTPALKKNIYSSDSDSDCESRHRRSVSSGSLADADRRSDKKKKVLIKFYSSDSDDEIPVSFIHSKSDNNPGKQAGSVSSNIDSDSLNKHTGNGKMPYLPTIPSGSGSAENNKSHDDWSAVVLSDSEDDILASLEIPEFNNQSVKEDTNSRCENKDKKQPEGKTDTQNFPGAGHQAKNNSDDSNIDVRLKLREVWGKKNDSFLNRKDINNVNRSKVNIFSKSILNKEKSASNDHSTLPFIKRPQGKHKRLSSEEELPGCSKKSKLSDTSDTYSYTKIEDVFSRVRSKITDTTDSCTNTESTNVKTKSVETESVPHHDCPVCGKSVIAADINSHLDICLGTS